MDLQVKNLVEMLSTLDNLATERRYKSLHIIDESVLDHIGLSMQILAHTQHLLPEDVDKFEIAMELTLHDNGEAIVGDIEHKTKEQSKLEAQAVKALFVDYPEAYEFVHRYSKKESKESKIVKSIDILQATIRLYLAGSEIKGQLRRTRETEDTLFRIDFDDNIYIRMIQQLRDAMTVEGYFLSE